MPAKLFALIATTALIVVALPASAQDGAWKVGNDYVVRYRHLDLDQPTDRRALLIQIERAATKLCSGEATANRRAACSNTAIDQSLKSIPLAVRQAVETARMERDGQQQAQR